MLFVYAHHTTHIWRVDRTEKQRLNRKRLQNMYMLSVIQINRQVPSGLVVGVQHLRLMVDLRKKCSKYTYFKRGFGYWAIAKIYINIQSI